MTVYLEDFCSDPSQYNSASLEASDDPTLMWSNAFAHIQSKGGGKLYLGRGSFLSPTVRMPHGIQLEGEGGRSTRIVHRPGTGIIPLDATNRNYVTIGGLHIDGGYPTVKTLTTPFLNGEVSLTGTGNVLDGVTITNFNSYGVVLAGNYPVVKNCVIEGIRKGVPYGSDLGSDLGSVFGIIILGNAVCNDPQILGNRVSGTRGAGMTLCGANGRVNGNVFESCHMGYLPDIPPTGGGQLGLGPMIAGPSYGWIVSENTIKASNGPVASGIEVDSCYDMGFSENNVYGVQGFGYSIRNVQNMTLTGGLIGGCATSGVRVAENSSNISLNQIHFKANKIGVHWQSNANALSLRDCNFMYHVTRNFLNESSAASTYFRGNRVDSLDAIPNSA